MADRSKYKPKGEIKPYPVLIAAAAILLKEISRRKSVFEFGSGGSTLWFAGFVRKLVSIEDDKDWHVVITEALAEAGRTNTEVRLTKTKTLPDAITGTGLYNVVFVDCLTQNERRRSVILGAKHVKPGGWLVADDYGFPMTRKAVEGLRAKGWNVTVVSGTKTHPVSKVTVKTSTAFCHKLK